MLYLPIAVPFTCIVPQREAHEEEKIKPLLSQFMQQMNARMRDDCKFKDIPMTESELTSPLILPCIAEHRLKHFVGVTLGKAKISKC